MFVTFHQYSLRSAVCFSIYSSFSTCNRYPALWRGLFSFRGDTIYLYAGHLRAEWVVFAILHCISLLHHDHDIHRKRCCCWCGSVLQLPGSAHPTCRSPLNNTAGHKVYRVLSCAVSMLYCWFVCLFVYLLACCWLVCLLCICCPTVCSFSPPRVDAAYMFLIKLSFGNYLYFSTQLFTHTRDTHITVYLHCRNCSVFCALPPICWHPPCFSFLLFQVMSQAGYVRGGKFCVCVCGGVGGVV